MNISPLQDQSSAVQVPSSRDNQVKNTKGSVLSNDAAAAGKATTAGAAPVSAVAAGSSQSTVPVERPTDVSLRRDNNGRIYYVVSDANSGQEIIEVPPKALRDISQGIEDYLKETQSNAAAHLEIKA
jgi:hypothetical protein